MILMLLLNILFIRNQFFFVQLPCNANQSEQLWRANVWGIWWTGKKLTNRNKWTSQFMLVHWKVKPHKWASDVPDLCCQRTKYEHAFHTCDAISMLSHTQIDALIPNSRCATRMTTKKNLLHVVTIDACWKLFCQLDFFFVDFIIMKTFVHVHSKCILWHQFVYWYFVPCWASLKPILRYDGANVCSLFGNLMRSHINFSIADYYKIRCVITTDTPNLFGIIEKQPTIATITTIIFGSICTM